MRKNAKQYQRHDSFKNSIASFSVLRNSDGNIIVVMQKKLEHWRQYVSMLFDDTRSSRYVTRYNIKEDGLPISRNETKHY